MAYEIYLGDSLQLPLPPSKLELKIKNKNSTCDLMVGGQLNVLKTAGLTEISFEVILPQVYYSYATYPNGFKSAEYYLEEIEALKLGLKPFNFKVIRARPDGTLLFETNKLVSLEEYSIVEDVSEGFDVTVKIDLKEYREVKAQIVEQIGETEEGISVQKTKQRETTSAPKNSNYTVKKGDSLWNIAKQQLGDGSRWKEIYSLNKEIVGDNASLIYPNQVLALPS